MHHETSNPLLAVLIKMLLFAVAFTGNFAWELVDLYLSVAVKAVSLVSGIWLLVRLYREEKSSNQFKKIP